MNIRKDLKNMEKNLLRIHHVKIKTNVNNIYTSSSQNKKKNLHDFIN